MHPGCYDVPYSRKRKSCISVCCELNVGTSLVTSENGETRYQLRQTLLVIVACTAVPLVATLILIVVRHAASRRRRDRLAQRQSNNKDFTGHVMHAVGNGSQQLPLGYIHHQVNLDVSHCSLLCALNIEVIMKIDINLVNLLSIFFSQNDALCSSTSRYHTSHDIPSFIFIHPF